ncbi:hypothetical protein FJT64_011301 [Amphibalanus amphitrite]|uniref:Uncharacterized protein n=1 Tax=Amphibalanus amphitrite TaxID=1232801 RepID=A0A6A4V2J0_AMPAM|nr:hypothetical protein FJT64_011301 [Amphibalanus amphitrite]
MHGTVKLSAWEEPKDEAVVVVRKNSIGDEAPLTTDPTAPLRLGYAPTTARYARLRSVTDGYGRPPRRTRYLAQH